MPKPHNKVDINNIRYLLEKTDILLKKVKKEARKEKEKRGCEACGSPLVYALGLCRDHYYSDRDKREAARLGKIWQSTDGLYRIYNDEGKVQLYHRYLMEQELGRKLNRSEVVKHIDRNKTNNTISNLAIVGVSLEKLECPHCGETFIKTEPVSEPQQETPPPK